ncbi:MAG: hypothetical protein ACPGN3_14885 [Opitutales bacterium]
MSLDHAAPLSKWVGDVDTWTWWLREPPTDRQKLEESIRGALSLPGEREPFVIYSKELADYVGETSY